MADVRATESRQTEVLVVAWLMTGLASCTVAFKLLARFKVVRVIGWDDFFIVLSLVFSIIASAFVHYGVSLGFGRHTEVVAAEYGMERLFRTAKFQILGYRKLHLSFLTQYDSEQSINKISAFNIGAFSFPNIAIAILVTQLLDPNPRRAMLLHGMAILQVVFAVVTVILAFAQCQPTAKLWEKTLPGSCWSPNVLNYFSYWFCAYTTATDVVLAVVPVWAFRKLQMRLATKVGICILMSMTMFSAIVTIVKGTYLPLFTDTVDPLYNPVPLVIWGLIEQNIVIMAACVPTMRPLFNTKRMRSTNKSGSRSNTSNIFLKSSPDFTQQKQRDRESSTEIILNDMNQKGDTASYESEQGIVRTVEVSMDWKASPKERNTSARDSIVPQAITDSERSVPAAYHTSV